MSSKYKRHLNELHKGERGFVTSAAGGGFSVALVFPNRYFVAMSNLGFLSIYRTINDIFEANVERATLPEREDEIFLTRSGKPILTIESQKGLREFDSILFSISFENDYLNLLKILKISKIPLRSEDRDENYPLIGAGGAAVTINPESIAPFIDFFALGEGEELSRDIVESLVWSKDAGLKKEDILLELSNVPGIYVPDHFSVEYDARGRVSRFYNRFGRPDRIKVRKISDLSKHRLSSSIVTPDTEFSEMFLIEVERGCPYLCAFCVTPSIYGPVRMRGVDDIIYDINDGMRLTGKVGLLGPSISGHPKFLDILGEIKSGGGRLGLPSLRAELLSDEGARLLCDLNIRTLTIAPESGNEELRAAIGKSVRTDEIFDLVERSTEAGIINFRLYFLVGLPGETERDIDAIADMVKHIRHIVLSRTSGKGVAGKITVSVNPFVPKPHTPLMWANMEEQKVLTSKINAIRSALKGTGGISVIYEPPKWSYIQALLSRGDRKVADILDRAADLGEDWKAAMRDVSINPDFYVLRERDEDEIFPWDFIDLGLDKGAMYRRYLKIMSKVKRS